MLPFPPQILPFRISLWIAARLMPLSIAGQSLQAILQRATPAGDARPLAGLSAETITRAVKRTGKGPWLMRNRRCLREGLLAFHYLRLAGYRPVLRFGLMTASVHEARPRAHCWVLLDDKTILNPLDEPMVTLFDYDGSPLSGPGKRAMPAFMDASND